MYLVTVDGMGGKLVNETLLLPSKGFVLIAMDTCFSIGRSVIFLLQRLVHTHRAGRCSKRIPHALRERFPFA